MANLTAPMQLRRLLALSIVVLIVGVLAALVSGRVAYVSTSGVSMEPTYSPGDLVLVSRDGDYGVGDAVAYRDPGTGATVLHRIVGGDGPDGFVLRGDTNRSTDRHAPTADQLTGRAVAHVPHLGGVLAAPATKAVIALSLAGLFGSLAIPSSERNTMSNRRDATTDHPSRNRARDVWRVALALDVVLLFAVVAAFTLRPAPAGAQQPVGAAPPEHHLELGYGADVVRSETYPEGRIETGDTVFRTMADTVDVFARSHGAATDGYVELGLTVSSSAGWERSATLVERTELGGDADLDAVLTFAEIDRLAKRITSETGVGAGTLDVAITLTGEARVGEGERVDLHATLPLRLSPETVTLIEGEATVTEAGPVLASTIELPRVSVDDGGPGTDDRPDLTRPAVGALLLAVAVTAVTWPNRAEGDGVVRVRSTGAFPSPWANSVEVADASDVEGIARQVHAPILCRDDGWQGVVSGDVLYWTPPSRISGGSGARP